MTYLIIIISTLSANAKSIQQNLTIPSILVHQLPGCPANSKCLKKTGAMLLKWKKLFKHSSSAALSTRDILKMNKLRKKNGMPLEVWTTREAFNSAGIVHWDSPCNQHNKKTFKLYQSVVIAPSFKELKKFEKTKYQHIFIRKAYLANGNKVEEYFIPRDESPLFIKNNELYFVKNENESLFFMAIKKNGDISLHPKIQVPIFPQKIQCPEVLSQAITADKESYKKLYYSHYCINIKNISTGKNQVLALGWSCY